jgi:2-aminoadipate transaminase
MARFMRAMTDHKMTLTHHIHHLARRMALVQPNAVGALLRAGADPGIVSFAGGYPDGALFPKAELDALYHHAITEQGSTSLQYTVAEGDPALRAALATRYGAPFTPDDVLILQGSQQGLDLVAKLLVNPGDVIVTERPTFLGAMIGFNPCEPRYVDVPIDGEGMITEMLEQKLDQSLRPKFVYTIPDFQNPTGANLSIERRKHLVTLASEFDFLILEDTAYRPLRYRGDAPPSLLSLDHEGRVIHLGSFSKVLAPGMRLGWAIASRPMIERLGLLKLAADTQCSTLNMAVAAGFLQQHDLDAHVEKLRAAYAKKRDVMADAIRQYFPQEVTFTEPDGGLFIWVTFPKGFNTADFMASHAIPDAKVAFVPGASFFSTDEEHHHARFNFSGPTAEQIVEGIARLGKVLKRELRS